MQYTDFIQKTLDYIEEHIHDEIRVEDCAQIAGFSKYHFHRIFNVLVGTSVMDYVRRRKLSHAMKDVTDGKRLLDIAMDYGYNSERAFSRAFINEYKESPKHYRGQTYHVPPMINVYQEFISGGYFMNKAFSEVYFETLEDMVVVSAVIISHNPEEEVITLMNKWAKESNIPLQRTFGFDYPVSATEQVEGKRGYEYWLQVNPETQPTGPVTLKKIAGCQYAVLKITDPFSDPFDLIPQGWKALVKWLDQNGYRGDSENHPYCLEEVIEENNTTYMKVMIPIN